MDGTNGFRNTGVIEWDVADLAGFAVGTGGEYLIRITRTRNALSTTPIVDLVQISALTEFKWDKNADVNLNSLTLVTDLAVAHGGTGRSSHTAYAVLCGGTTATAAQQSIASVGTAGQVLTSNGAGALPTFQAHTVPVMTVTSVASGASPYTVLAADQYISCNVSAGILSIMLPDTTTTGRVIIVKDSTGDAATNNLTVTTVTGAVTIDGATSFVMNTDYESANFIWNGTSYEVH